MLRGSFFTRLGVDPLNNTRVHGVRNRDAVVAPPHWIAVIDAVIDNQSKDGLLSAVRGYDDALAAHCVTAEETFSSFAGLCGAQIRPG